MQLKISNVGKIENATIDVNGITVIAGENNAGKSTIGKTMFAIFNSMNNMDEKIAQERKNRIRNIINGLLKGKIMQNIGTISDRRRRINIISTKLLDAIMEYLDSEEVDTLEAYLRKQISETTIFDNHEDEEEFVTECAAKVEALLAISDKRVMTEVVTRWFGRVFEGQISPLWEEEIESEIEIVIKDKKILYHFKENTCISLETEVNILHQAFYIDNPFIVDEMSSYIISSDNIMKNYLLNSLQTVSEDIYENIFDAVAAKEKLAEINEISTEVIDGDIEKNQDGEYCFKSNNYAEPLNVVNMSTGMKSFALIKRLLESGNLKEKDVIILDEPEIHLHPEWQLLYAKMIVLLQKHFDLSMIITTHSPYFLDAIDVFSAKYNIADRTKYYLAENTGNTSVLQDVTNNIDAIYKKLSDPMQMLENLRYNG
jgi:ABC transporter, ATP-binding protein